MDSDVAGTTGSAPAALHRVAARQVAIAYVEITGVEVADVDAKRADAGPTCCRADVLLPRRVCARRYAGSGGTVIEPADHATPAAAEW